MNTDPDSWSVVIDRAKYACFVSQFLFICFFLFVISIETVPFTSETNTPNIRKKTHKKPNNLYILYIEHLTHIVKYKYRL